MSIGEKVYLELKKSILELNRKPGEVVNIKDLCEQYGVSRSPVRDALIKLEKEGLIKSLPQSGTIVSKISLDLVEQERYLRNCLEEKTLLLFLKEHTKNDIDRLNSIIDMQEKIYEENTNFREFLKWDEEFHKIFFIRTNKELCWQTIDTILGNYRRIRLLALCNKDIRKNVIAQHRQIIDYITKYKEQELVEIINKHLSRLTEEKKVLLVNYPDLFEKEDLEVSRKNKNAGKDFLEHMTQDRG